ncbi:MAG: MMPL family transporter [Geodermatophilaceae bacterium]|nr:MMPL family transporter [Geodermatophilaceae bacterium]
MFAWWGTVVTKLRKLLIVLGIAFGAFAGIWGTGVFSSLDGDSSLDDPNSESQLINDRVTEELGRQSTDLVALYSSDTLSVDDPAFEQAVVEVTDTIRDRPEVELVTTYYETEADNLVSTDGSATYVPIRFVAGTDDDVISEVRDQLAAPGLTTQVGGSAAIDLDINDRIGPDIAKAEMIAMPILLIALLIVLGNVVAALIPLVIGGLAILGAFTVLRVVSAYTELSAFSINIITILGLGLAVDYGLFMVSRFREELDRGATTADAVSRTMATAGRTVAVSGVIVGLSLSSLLIFPQVLLRSMGLGGAAAVLVAMVVSLTVLPAMLAALGPKIDAGRLPWARRRRVPTITGAVSKAAGSNDHGWWARVAHSVMRRPVLYVIGTVAVLLVLAAPLAGVQFGGIDERALPEGTESRVVSERLADEFSDAAVQPIRVLVSEASLADAEDFAGDIAAIPGVRGAAISDNEGNSSMITVTYDGEPSSLQARGIVEDIRASEAPAGAEVMVGGSSASVVDQLTSLTERLPWMVLLVAGITFVLLAVAFGSLVVPIKAIVMNLISIAAAFGVVTWIFQDGHLSGVLGFTPTGYVEASQPILMVAILFGLSMDYEVFLLSRIRERWDALGDNTAAVASGVQRTGGIITAAAVMLCVVTGAFSTSGITFIKMVGVGMFVALIVDATLVRLLLVPATMRLLGRHNWWAPSFLSRLYGRYGVREEAEPTAPRPVVPVTTKAEKVGAGAS